MTIRPQISAVGSQTIIYGFGNVLSKLAAFFLIPVYTRFLSTSEVGILALLEMAELFLTTVAPLGVIRAVWRYLPNTKREEQQKIILSAYLGTLVLNVVILGLIGLNYQSLAQLLGLTEKNSAMFLIVLINILLAFGIRFILSLWQYNQKPISYLVLSLSQFIGVLIATIVLVVFKGWGLWGVLFAKLFIYGGIFVFSAIVILRSNRSLPSVSLYNKLLKYGFPLIMVALVTPVLTVSDRFFLKLFVSLDEIGIYSIGYKFGMLINMLLVVPLQRGWVPMMYRLGVEEKSHEYYRDIMFYYAVIGSLFFLALSFFIESVLRVVATPEYISGAFIVPIVTAGYFVNGFRQFFTTGAALKDKTPRLALAATVGIFTNLILNYMLIKSYGVQGAAWATLFSYLILVISVYIVSQGLVRINWRWGRLFKLCLIVVFTFVVTHHVQVRVENWETLISVAGLIVFPVILWVTGTIGPREINGLRSLLRMGKT